MACNEDVMAKSEDFTRDRKPQSFHITRRQLFPLLGATTAMASNSLAAAPFDAPEKPSNVNARFVYVGTYTAPGVPPGGTHPSTAVGIYVFKLRPSDGGLTPLQVVPASNPSYLALDPSLRHLYSVNEDTAGRVSAYTVNNNGTLTFLNAASANGKDTTHLSVQHPLGQYLFAANYTSGNFPVYRILADGSIGAMTDEFQNVGNGTGPNPARQEGPHAHQIITDQDGDHCLAWISAPTKSMS
jgi:6-phosphogluconolactonase